MQFCFAAAAAAVAVPLVSLFVTVSFSAPFACYLFTHTHCLMAVRVSLCQVKYVIPLIL